MDEIFQRAAAYARAKNLTFTRELGAGIHGVLAVLRSHGLFMFDVSSSNIAFA